jgi:allophanate hydrolase
MDRFSYAAAQAMLGNDETSTSVEVSLGGLVLECVEGETTFAIAGGSFSLTQGDRTSEGWATQTIRQGEKLTVRAGSFGSWTYLAFAGRISVDSWLGSTSTHSMSGFGAGALTAGLEFEVVGAERRDNRIGGISCPKLAMPKSDIRVVVGPQDQHFDPVSINVFCSEPYQITDAFDRMGVRLKGPLLSLKNALSIPSEPIVRGSIQVSGDGVPTVLLADHQTTGGYPKMATIISSDVDRLAQLRAGDTVRFTTVSAQEAIEITRDFYKRSEIALAELAAPKAPLEERLLNLNLIGGVMSAASESG